MAAKKKKVAPKKAKKKAAGKKSRDAFFAEAAKMPHDGKC